MACHVVTEWRTWDLHSPHLFSIFIVRYCRLGGVWKIWKGLRGAFPELIPHSVGGLIELCLVFGIIKHLFPLICSFSSEMRGYLSCDNKKEPKKKEKVKSEDWHFLLKWAQYISAFIIPSFSAKGKKNYQQSITYLKPIPGTAVIKAKFKIEHEHFHQETLAVAETGSQASPQPQFQYHLILLTRDLSQLGAQTRQLAALPLWVNTFGNDCAISTPYEYFKVCCKHSWGLSPCLLPGEVPASSPCSLHPYILSPSSTLQKQAKWCIINDLWFNSRAITENLKRDNSTCQ